MPDEDEDDAEDDDEEEEDDAELDEDEEEGDYNSALPEAEEARGRFAKPASLAQLQDQFSDDDDEPAEKEGEGSESEEETWGANAYHATRRQPGEPDSSDDEALDLEAEEARRLQKKLKGTLGGEDFGFLEEGEGAEEIEEVRQRERKKGKLEDDAEAGVSTEVPSRQLGDEEAIAYLVKKHPETLALLDDFRENAQRMTTVEKNLQVVRAGGEDGKEHPALAIMELEHRTFISSSFLNPSFDRSFSDFFSCPDCQQTEALSTYLPTLAFYFSLLLSTPSPSSVTSDPSTAPSLVEKVLERLSSLREALATMEELDLTSGGADDSSSEEDDDESGDEMNDGEDEALLASDVWDLAGGEDEDDLMEVDDSEDDDEEGEEGDFEFDSDDYDEEEQDAATDSMLQGMSDSELEALMLDMAGDIDADMLIDRVKAAQRAKKGLPPLDEPSSQSLPSAGKAGSKRKRSTKSEQGVKKQKDPLQFVPILAPLSTSTLRKIAPIPPPDKKSKKSSTASSKARSTDDYLDPLNLSTTDVSDKAQARHSLRFHVSAVHQKSLKRESGNGLRVGGDDDLPRKSKEASRREVLKRQEHGGAKGEALDGRDWDEDDATAAKSVQAEGRTKALSNEERRGDTEDIDPEAYYELVKKETQDKKREKKEQYDDQRSAEKYVSLSPPFFFPPPCLPRIADFFFLRDFLFPREALDAESAESPAGPRGATRKILANKGLQPKRAKVNRNPRVKKRLRYDKAVKKVATMKSVYKGAMQGEYVGEKSGIGKGVVKSVRLG